MRRNIAVFIIFGMLSTLFAGCGQVEKSPEGEKKLSIITTIFPAYDWVRQIISGNEDVELTMLLDNGVDLHSYQPTVADMVRISTCDVFIYVGGESDSWVDDALKDAVNKDMMVIDLLEVLGDSVKEEEIVEGMEHEDDHDEDDEEAHHELDEHVWLSLKHAQTLCRYLSEALSALDAGHGELYRGNTETYLEKLSGLDARYQETVAQADGDTIVFADRFPFRYLADDYGLNYYAAFSGCAAETEASFETVVFLAQKVEALGLHTVLNLEGSSTSLADTVISSAASQDAKVLTMDSMQSVTAKDVAQGASYLSIMEKNLEVLKAALN